MNITAAHTYSHSCDATVKRVVHFLTWRCQFSHLISGAGEPEGARRIQATSSATSLPDEGHPRSPPLHNQSVSSPTRSTTFLTTCYTPSIRPPSPSTSPRLLAFPASLHPPPTFAFHPFSLFVFYPPPRPALSLLSTLSNSPVYSLLKPLLPLFFFFFCISSSSCPHYSPLSPTLFAILLLSPYSGSPILQCSPHIRKCWILTSACRSSDP